MFRAGSRPLPRTAEIAGRVSFNSRRVIPPTLVNGIESKVSVRIHTEREVRRIGNEFGWDLGAGLLLASECANTNRALKRQMVQIVLNQIEAAVGTLQEAAFPADLTSIYKRAGRQGVRDALLKNSAIAAQLHRRAA